MTVLGLIFLFLIMVSSPAAAQTTYSPGTLTLTTDKCQYGPGDIITISVTGTIPSGAKMRFRQGLDVVGEPATISGSTITWTAPSADYTGYLADVYKEGNNGSETIYATIAIDVSSTWNRFPRYGFAATYDASKTDAVIESEAAFLNRFHINGIQYYDWQYLHEIPYDKYNRPDTWTDCANRQILGSVVRKYISEHHKYSMKAMFYNLLFGADAGYGDRGVKYEWSLFTDPNHSDQDYHPLPDGWIGNIYLRDPSNTEWKEFLAEKNEDVYDAFDFDGYHIDQLGFRGTRYNYDGGEVNLPWAYKDFINTMKEKRPDKLLVMNGVSDYGGNDIISTGNVEFSYTELWDSDDSFSNMERLVREHAAVNGSGTPSVFAAYMNYNRRDETGQYFNTPGILLSDAAMFAVGGSHLELGDGHMLCAEYFPNGNLRMSNELTTALTTYYDFMTAYENLLRDGGEVVDAGVSCTNGVAAINSWPPVKGQVTAYSRQKSNCKVVNLLNFSNVSNDKHLTCRDVDGDMPEPSLKQNLQISISASNTTRVWMASPDRNGGVPQELEFVQSGNDIVVTVPSLKYWTMVVIEQDEQSDDPVVLKPEPMVVGSAVYSGWYPRNAAMMVRQNELANVFTYTGWLEAGEGKEFKFLTQCNWSGDEYRNGDGSTSIISGDGTLQLNGDDNKFMVSETANYTITVNLDEMIINVTKAYYQSEPIYYNVLYLVGDNTPGGWDLTAATPLVQDAENPFLFTAQVHMTAPINGTFKIATNPNSSYDDDLSLGAQQFFFRDNSDSGKISDDATDDRKWTVPAEDDYLVRVNLQTKDIDIWRAITIGQHGAATYCIDRQLDFDGMADISAYTVEGTSGNGDIQGITAKEITAAPAGTGLLLLGTPGKYFVPTTDRSTDDCSENKLVGTLASTAISGEMDGKKIYLLGNGSHGLGFYRSASGTLAANKSYLALSAAQVATAIIFDTDFLNGISNMENGNNQQECFYTLSGVKVQNPRHGIYITNGKKIFVR